MSTGIQAGELEASQKARVLADAAHAHEQRELTRPKAAALAISAARQVPLKQSPEHAAKTVKACLDDL